MSNNGQQNGLSNSLVPKDGLEGLKENFSTDALSGFIVFLLAMPLSLGIAKASNFPAIMGIITAMVGGLLVSIFAGSRLTIKGPAAGLIVIASGCVSAFGGGEEGWHMALGCIVVAAVVQIVFGLLKLANYSDFVPSSAIHGMLAAIGLIIFSKQFYTLFGVDLAKDLHIDAEKLKDIKPLELYAYMPQAFSHIKQNIAIIGLASLAIMFGLPMIKNKFIKKIPAPLVVLLLAIPAGMYFQLDKKSLVNLGGTLIDNLKINVSFAGITKVGVFIQYVVLFALIGSIESLLTVKAIDGRDEFHRKSNYNKDLIAVGFGNLISGILGGLPMISEVARSSANVNNGAKTRWANFFHGLSLLIFVLVAKSVIELIPSTALAAMLISVAYKLAHPKEFRHALHIGKEQFIVFTATVIITLATDLLIGVFSGIMIELLFNLYLAHTKPGNIFKAHLDVEKDSDHHYNVKIHDSATFSNFLSIKGQLDKIPSSEQITLDLSDVELADHTVIENLEAIARDFKNAGGTFEIVGLDSKVSMGAEHSSARARRKPA